MILMSGWMSTCYRNYISHKYGSLWCWWKQWQNYEVFKNCAPFAEYISEINNTQIDNAKDIDVLMPIYNIVEHSDEYLITSRGL